MAPMKYQTPGGCGRYTTNIEYLHAQCVHCYTAVMLLRSVPILPDGITELRALHNNLTDGNTRSRLDRLDNAMDSCIQAKYQACVITVEHKVASSDQHLRRTRDSGWGQRRLRAGGVGFSTHVEVKCGRVCFCENDDSSKDGRGTRGLLVVVLVICARSVTADDCMSAPNCGSHLLATKQMQQERRAAEALTDKVKQPLHRDLHP